MPIFLRALASGARSYVFIFFAGALQKSTISEPLHLLQFQVSHSFRVARQKKYTANMTTPSFLCMYKVANESIPFGGVKGGPPICEYRTFRPMIGLFARANRKACLRLISRGHEKYHLVNEKLIVSFLAGKSRRPAQENLVNLTELPRFSVCTGE